MLFALTVKINIFYIKYFVKCKQVEITENNEGNSTMKRSSMISILFLPNSNGWLRSGSVNVVAGIINDRPI